MQCVFFCQMLRVAAICSCGLLSVWVVAEQRDRIRYATHFSFRDVPLSLLSTRYLLTTCGDVCGLELRDFIARPANTASPDSPGCLWRPVQLIDSVSVRGVRSRTKKLPWKNKGT